MVGTEKLEKTEDKGMDLKFDGHFQSPNMARTPSTPYVGFTEASPSKNSDEPVSSERSRFSIYEATIPAHRQALSSGIISAVELLSKYLVRISAYDLHGPCLNSFTNLNPSVLIEAAESDLRRKQGKLLSPMDGIPYTLKDNFQYKGLPLSCGSPAFANLRAMGDSHIAAQLRAAGAILVGQTNMPPMAAGGMQRGLYGRAESPYNTDYLTAAFSSGSSNGAATSTASSFAAFAIGTETVSSGRSPASNNALVAWTPSRGVLSNRGFWPLYVTCDVPVPYTRCMEDMWEVLPYLLKEDGTIKGDFWKEQSFVKLPNIKIPECDKLNDTNILCGKKIGIPRMYINKATTELDPDTKAIVTNPSIIALWKKSKAHLESMGAMIIECDFPLVTNYEDDRMSGVANNILNIPEAWSKVERTTLIAKSWDDFLINNNDPNCRSLSNVDGSKIFPKPPNYLPDMFFEVANGIDYTSIPALSKSLENVSIYSTPGLSQALHALESQRQRDLEDWLTTNNLDFVVFPACADVAPSDLEFSEESAKHALQNGVKYSNGNRALRHLGVPTVSVPMGVMEDTKMPVNLTFLTRAYQDEMLLKAAWAFELVHQGRRAPSRTPELDSDSIASYNKGLPLADNESEAKVSITSFSKTYVPHTDHSTVDDDTKESSSHTSSSRGMYRVSLSGSLTLKCRDTLPTLQVYVGGKEVFSLSTESADRDFYRSHLDCEGGTWGIEAELEDWPKPLGWDLQSTREHQEVDNDAARSGSLGNKILAVAIVKCGVAVDADFVLI